MRDALGGTYLSDKEPIMNSRTDDLSCIDPSCNSIEFEIHRSETHCVICGLSKGSGVMDPGFAPSSTDPDGLNDRVTGKPSTGSEIPLRFDRKFDRLSNLQKRETRQDVQFLEQIIGHVLHSCGNTQTASMAVALLDRVNSVSPLGARRKKMNGDKEMSDGDGREYRARVYAAAAVDVLNSDGRANRSRQISRDWGLNYSDFTGAKRFINTHRRRISCDQASRVPRSRIINQEITTNTEFLAQIIGRDSANEVRHVSMSILREHLELLDDDDVIGVGRFTNQPPRKAALIATIEAMAIVKVDRKAVRQLYALNPVPGGSNYVERSAHLFREN